MSTHTISGTITCGASGGSISNNWNGCYQNTASKKNRHAGQASGDGVWYASNIMYGTGLDSLRNKSITSITLHIKVTAGTVWANTDGRKWNIGFKYTNSSGANTTSSSQHWARTSNASQTAMGTYSVAYLTSNYSSGSGWYDVPLGTTLPKYGYCIGPTAGYTSQTRLTFDATTTLIVVVPDYTVTYKPGANGTGSQTTDTKEYGDTLTLKGAIFTRTGYTQTGWATSDGGAQAYSLGGSYTANANQTLYPVWTPITYTISFDKGQYGTGTNTTDTKTYGVALTLPGAIFTRTGYEQKGWTLIDGSSTKDYDLGGSYTTESANTLYPYWEVSSIIHVKYNGQMYSCPVYVKYNNTLYMGIVYVKENGTMTPTQ